MELAGLSTPESQWLAARVPHAPAMVCTSYQVQLAAIRAGLGVGVGPRVYADLDPDFIALDDPRSGLPALDVYVVTRRAIRTLPRVAAVVDAVSEGFSALSAVAPRRRA